MHRRASGRKLVVSGNRCDSKSTTELRSEYALDFMQDLIGDMLCYKIEFSLRNLPLENQSANPLEILGAWSATHLCREESDLMHGDEWALREIVPFHDACPLRDVRPRGSP